MVTPQISGTKATLHLYQRMEILDYQTTVEVSVLLVQWLKSTIRFCFRKLDFTWIFFYGKDKILFDQAYQQSHKYYYLDD